VTALVCDTDTGLRTPSLALTLLRIIARGVDNLPTNLVFLARTFLSRLIGHHLSDASRDLATLTLKVMALVADAGLRVASVYQIGSS